MHMTLRLVAVALVSLAAAGCRSATAASPETTRAYVRLTPDMGSLSTLLPAELKKAQAKKLKPFLELRAEWCKPCKQLEASMGDQRMADAFAGTYLISVDIDEFSEQLARLGFDASAIPVFYELNPAAKATGRKIDGGAWAENIPQNMAPPLKAFFAVK